jgi:hypothetical protein
MSRTRYSRAPAQAPGCLPIPPHASRESLFIARDALPATRVLGAPHPRCGCSDRLRDQGAASPWTAVRRIAAPHGVPSARHSLTSTIIVITFREDSGLWEDPVDYRAPFPPGNPDPPGLSGPSRTTTRTVPTRHHSHSPTTRQQAAASRIPRPTDRITYRGDEMAAAASMTSRRTGPAPADLPRSPTGLGCRVRLAPGA